MATGRRNKLRLKERATNRSRILLSAIPQRSNNTLYSLSFRVIDLVKNSGFLTSPNASRITEMARTAAEHDFFPMYDGAF